MLLQRKLLFNLTELIIVIVLLVILLSLLVPMFSNDSNSARKAVCLANTANLHKAFASNSKNHNGRYFWDTTTGNNGKFPNNITYVNTSQLDLDKLDYFCPVKKDYMIDAAWEFNALWRVTNYIYTFERPDGNISTRNIIDQDWVGFYSEVENPDTMPLVIDDTFKIGDEFSWKSPLGEKTNHYGENPLDQNAAFVDGHAKRRQVKELKVRIKTSLGDFWW